MTGYGRDEHAYKGGVIAVELRAVNHKYCDISMRLPKVLAALETGLRKTLQQRFARGRIELSVGLNGSGEVGRALKLDLKLARDYHRLLEQLKKGLKIKGEVDLGMLLGLRDLIVVEESAGLSADLEPLVQRSVTRAMDQLETMRMREGATLARDLAQRIGAIRTGADRIRERAPAVIEDYRRRLEARIQQLAGGIKVDPDRIAQEVAFHAERCDISEELTRLASHLTQFDAMLKSAEPVGRSMDFLIQEMHREVNTVGSKANDARIAQDVVTLKSELEKLREQVQNIE